MQKPSRFLQRIILLSVCLLAGCSVLQTPATPTPTQPPSAASQPPAQIIVAVTDLAMGTNRLAFALIDPVDPARGPLIMPEVEAEIFSPDPEVLEPRKIRAIFRPWPTGVIGLYTAQVEFNQPGQWALQVQVTDAEGRQRVVGTALIVKEQSLTPTLGERPPPTQNQTAEDVSDLAELTTADPPDPDLYSITIAEALDAGKPAVVVFSTPAYCTSAICGPQLEVVRELKDRHKDQANFIHLDIYANPAEIQGDLSRARLNPALSEWGLPSEPWTFLVDAQGRLAAKFEGFATREELEEALLPLLSGTG